MPDAPRSVAGPRAVAEVTCPRCGSAEVRRLSLIHQTGLATASEGHREQTALSRCAAPPAPKYALLWTLMALAAAVFAIGSCAPRRPGTVVLGTVALVATVSALRGAHYNRMVYPELQKLWAHSFMCSRCGEVFSS